MNIKISWWIFMIFLVLYSCVYSSKLTKNNNSLQDKKTSKVPIKLSSSVNSNDISQMSVLDDDSAVVDEFIDQMSELNNNVYSVKNENQQILVNKDLDNTSSSAGDNVSENMQIIPVPTNIPAIKNSPSILNWIGYDYRKEEFLVKIDLAIQNISQTTPKMYWISENTDEWYTLIIQLNNILIRRGLQWDINASEFISPVKYIKVLKKDTETLIVFKLTEKITPKVVVNNENISLLFDIPKHYFQDDNISPEENTIKHQQISEQNKQSYNKVINGAFDIHLFWELKRINVFNVAQADSQELLKSNFNMDQNETIDNQQLQQTITNSNNSEHDKNTSSVQEVYGNQPELQQSFEGHPIKMEFYKAPLRQVLKVFSDQSGINFIVPDTIGDLPVTVKLDNVPWDSALKAILDTNKLVMTKLGENIVRVDDVRLIQSYLESKDQAVIASIKSEDTKILVMKLSNAEASTIQNQLSRLLQLNKFGDKVKIVADKRTNTVLLEAPPIILKKAKSIVERLDLPTPQVEIASRIIEVNRSITNFLGISWDGGLYFDGGRGLGFGSLAFPNSLSAPFVIDPGVSNSSAVGSLNLNIGSLNDVIDLDLRLRMEEARGTTEVLQSNKIVVADRSSAVIRAGMTEFFRNTASPTIISQSNQVSSGEFNMSSVEYNLTLNVKPQVTSDGHVNMQLDITSDSPAAAASPGAQATKNTRSLSTTLLKRSGETAVIGGIFDNKKRKNINGIPVLSYLPIIGALFRSISYSENQIELMVLITPTILPQTVNIAQSSQSSEINKQQFLNSNNESKTHSTNSLESNNKNSSNMLQDNSGVPSNSISNSNNIGDNVKNL